jgi:hypothetical protein
LIWYDIFDLLGRRSDVDVVGVGVAAMEIETFGQSSWVTTNSGGNTSSKE